MGQTGRGGQAVLRTVVSTMVFSSHFSHFPTVDYFNRMHIFWIHLNNFILLENELGTFAFVEVASMQWGTLVKT